jgi:vacuolar-type H+-ATPase subunit I/STV1
MATQDNNALILQQLQKMEDKLDNLATALHETNLEMTRIGGMKHALQDLKAWKENVESIVNPEDLREMKKALQEIKASSEEIDRLESELKSIKEDKAKDRVEIEDLKTFKIKAKTVVAILSILFSTAITILGWFVS